MSTTAAMMTKVVKLPSSLDAGAAAELLEKLRQLPEPNWPVHLHARGVEQVSLAYIQVLVAAMRDNEHFAVVDPPAVLVEGFAELGLSLREAEAGMESDDLPMLDSAPAPDPASAPDPALSTIGSSEHLPAVMSPPVAPESSPSGAVEEVVDKEAAPEPSEAPAVGADATTVASIAPEQPTLEQPLLEQPRLEQPSLEQPPESAPVGRRILTIDDSKTIRQMLKLTLAQAGFTVLQAVDGQDGLEVLRKEEVDVVITDINMPKLDGYGVIRQIREDPTYDDTPILVLSTESDQENKNVARDAGATGWIVKPFVPDQLVDVIRKVCP